MSNTVDTRVVEMQFNNQDFERNVSTSLGTLEKLKSALNFGKSSQQLTQLQTATNNVDFSPFTNALDSVQSRFSALGVVGMTVINNLTNGIINKAKGILTAIPKQISEGGLSRAMNIENAKFQLKGLGVAWKDIEDDINYGVKDTAYGLDAAAKAASQLTASGVQLGDEMKEALRGISGVAAMTNSSYEEISPIFTTIAGQGKVMTMQLRQLESRGLNVAAELGKQMGKTEEDIRDMVTKGKIDFKTFSHYMNQAFGDHAKKANETYSGSLGNVKAALSRIGAEFKTSRLENLRNIFVAAIPALNKFKSDISEITTFVNLLSSMVSGQLANALESIDFGSIAQKANSVLNSINLGAGINYSDVSKLLGKVKEEGVLTTKTLKEAEKMGLNVTEVLAKSFGKTEKEIREDIKKGQIDYTRFASALGIAIGKTGKLGEVIEKIRNAIKSALPRVKSLFNEVVWIVKNIGFVVQDLFYAITEGFANGFKIGPLQLLETAFLTVYQILHDVGEALNDFVLYISESGNIWKIITFFEGLGTVLTELYILFKNVFQIASNVFRKLFFIKDESTWLTKLIDIVCNGLELLGKIMMRTEGVTVDVLDKIHNVIAKILDTVKTGFDPIITAFSRLSEKTGDLKESIKGLSKVFEAIGDVLRPVVSAIGKAVSGLWEGLVRPFKSNNANFLLTFISALEVALTSLLSLHIIDSLQQVSITFERFKGIISTIKAPFWDLQIALKAYQQSLKAGSLLKIGKAVLMLAGAMFVLSLIDQDKLVGVTMAMTTMMYALVGAFGLFVNFVNKTQGGIKNIGKIFALNGTLVAFAAALLILSFAAKNLSSVDWEDLKLGILGLGAIMAELGIFVSVAKLDGGRGKKTAIALIGIATSVYILSAALEKLTEIDPEMLSQGLGSMAAIFGMLGIFTNIVNSKKIISTGIALNIIAASLFIFAKSLEALGDVPVETLKTGLIAMAAALGIVAVAMRFMPKKGSIGNGVELAIIAASLLILAKALEAFGMLPLIVIRDGLIGIGGSLAIISVAMLLMKKTLPGAAALLVVCGALTILSGVIDKIGNMDTKKLVTGLVGLGAALGIIVLAGVGAQAAAVGLLALGAAVVLIGAGMLGIGTGLLAFSTGISLLVATGSAGLAFFTTAIVNLINMIPLLMTQLGNGFIALIDVLANSYDSFVRFGVTVMKSILDGFTQMVPSLMDTLTVLLDAGLTIVNDWLPKIVDTGVHIILEFLRGIEEATPDLVDRAFTLIITFIDSLTASIDAHAYELYESLKNLFLTTLKKIVVIIIHESIELFKAGRKLGEKLRDGVAKLKDAVKEKFVDMVNSAKEAIREKWQDFKNAGKHLIEGFINGLESIPIVGKVVNLAKSAISAFTGKKGLDEHSPSKKSYEAGKYFVLGFCVALKEGKATVKTAVGGLISSFVINGKKIKFFDTVIDHIRKQTKEFVDKSVKNITWGKSTIENYLKNFTKAVAKADGTYNTKTKVYKNASKSVGELSKKLYLNSEAYYESTRNVRAYNKALEKETKKHKKIYDKLMAIKKDNSKKAHEQRAKLMAEYKESSKNIKALGKGLNEELKNIANGSKKAYQAYRQSLRSMVQDSVNILSASVSESINLFTEFAKADKIPVNKLLKTMESQIVGISKWRDSLAKLGKTKIAKGLLDELRAMGPEAAGYINAFLEMTDEELEKANLMYKAKGELTGESLIDSMKQQIDVANAWADNLQMLAKRGLNFDLLNELSSSGLDTADYVNILVNMTDAQLDEINKLYKKTKKLPSSVADSVLSALAISNEGKGNISGIKDMGEALATVLSDAETAKAAVDAGQNLAQALSEGIESSEGDIIEASKTIGTSSLNEFTKYFNTENGTTIAIEMVNGLVVGLETGIDGIEAVSRELAEASYNAAADELDIHSPSKKFESLGKNSGLGYINGFRNMITTVKSTAEAVGDSALDSLKGTMSRISDFLNDEINNPVITPTLDLSEISSHAGRISGYFNNPNLGVDSEIQNGISNGKVFNFTQNNYSPKALTRIEIYRQTKNILSTAKGSV